MLLAAVAAPSPAPQADVAAHPKVPTRAALDLRRAAARRRDGLVGLRRLVSAAFARAQRDGRAYGAEVVFLARVLVGRLAVVATGPLVGAAEALGGPLEASPAFGLRELVPSRPPLRRADLGRRLPCVGQVAQPHKPQPRRRD